MTKDDFVASWLVELLDTQNTNQILSEVHQSLAGLALDRVGRAPVSSKPARDSNAISIDIVFIRSLALVLEVNGHLGRANPDFGLDKSLRPAKSRRTSVPRE